MRPETLVGMLAQPQRMRVFAAVVLGAGTPAEVAAATGLPGRSVQTALHHLERGGLVHAGHDGRLDAMVAVFGQAMREHRQNHPKAEPLDADQGRDSVLRAFIQDGRLVQMPAVRAKRRTVLEHIAASFEPGIRYPEPVVDAILRGWHDDYATLRRYLVDEDLLAREAGAYWRSGGYVAV
jgi:hypothetical protein